VFLSGPTARATRCTPGGLSAITPPNPPPIAHLAARSGEGLWGVTDPRGFGVVARAFWIA